MIRPLAAFALALAASAPSPVLAAPPASAVAARIDPERLAIADDIIAFVYPPEVRREMMDGITKAMDTQARAAMVQTMPELREPANEQRFQHFLERVRTHAKPGIEAASPALFTAMARAYARQFTRDELIEIRAFVGRPAGRKLFRQSAEIMADPDVAEANTAYMKVVFASLEAALAEMRREKEAQATQAESPGAQDN